MSTPGASTRLIGGRYRLDHRVGAGGMGTVWAGHDELLDRAVAVKEISFPAELGEHQQDELRERTLREARATARLSHPNVVTTYDVVEEDGRPWIVMELLSSRSLSAQLREEGPLRPHRVAELGLSLLSALELSHTEGVVHRDVKPGNVLITPDGRPVLTDFGIATMAGDPALTSTGLVLGSPAYMSPERARGERPGPAGDLWSLGATLYSAVEGRPPFDAGNALGTLTALLSDPVQPPTTPGPLRDAIIGLLAKDPAQRLDITTARALLEQAAAEPSTEGAAAPLDATVALDRAGRTEALLVALPPGAPQPPPPTAYDDAGDRGGRARLVATLLVVGLLLALGVVGYVATHNGDGDGGNTTAKSSGQPSGKASQSEKPSQSASSKPDPTSSRAEESPAAGGFTTYSDPTGFSLDVPRGWRATHNGTQVKFTEPGSTRHLLVDQTDHPKKDPAKDWEKQEKSVSKRLPNYARISIEPVDYRGWPAADWQFTYATQTQVIDRGFVVGERGYALYIQGPRGSFAESQAVFQRAADSFQPAAG